MKTHYQKALLLNSYIAGLLHDIGKINTQFQKKISSNKEKSSSDYVRHEYISLYVFYNVIIFGMKQVKEYEAHQISPSNDINIIHFLSQKGHLVQAFKFALERGLFNDKDYEIEDHLSYIEQINLLKKHDLPILYNIITLVISHHRLPDSRESSKTNSSSDIIVEDKYQYFKPSMSSYFNLSKKELKQLNFEFSDKKYNFMTVESSDFIESLSSSFQLLSSTLQEENNYYNTCGKDHTVKLHNT